MYYWLKYRHDQAAGHGPWEWRELGEFATELLAYSEANYVIEELSDNYGHSEMSRGAKYFVVPQSEVPRWIIEEKHEDARQAAKQALEDLGRFERQLRSAKDCIQCSAAELFDSMAPYDGRRSINCPTCGRRVFEVTLPYLLPLVTKPQKDALKLLGILVKGGEQKEGKNWPDDDDGSGISPMQWLIDLGLAGGESSQRTKHVSVWKATEKGQLEWKRRVRTRPPLRSKGKNKK